MSAQPQWITPAGSLGTIPDGVFYSTPLVAVDPLGEDVVFFALIAGQLPAGVQIQQTGLLTGVPLATTSVQGVPAEVSGDVLSRFAVRAYTQRTVNGVTVVNRLADRTFELTVAGQDTPEFTSPAGQLAQFYDGSVVSGLQVGYTDPDPNETVVVRLIAGQLPPGLTITRTGLISGFIPVTAIPGGTGGWSANGENWDQLPWSPGAQADSTNYEFTLEATDGTSSTLRTFSIFVWARSTLTADNTDITADNTFITADVSSVRPPIILNPPGTIGTVRNDNFFAYQFNGLDLGNVPFTLFPIITIGSVPNVNVVPPGDPQIELSTRFPAAVAGSGVLDQTLDQLWVYDGVIWDNFGSVPVNYTSALPPGLSLDPNSGWLYGYIPDTGIMTNVYSFSLLIKQTSNANIFSGPYNYSLTVTGPINSEIVWLTPSNFVQLEQTPSNLGSIVNGSVSTLNVRAFNLGGLELQYELDLGTASDPVYNLLPQGLELLPSGDIAGRVSFNTFAVDGGTTTFDVSRQNGADPTTFDLVRVFTVRAFSVDGVVNVTKTFSITVIRQFNTPYENLYIQCMPPQANRDQINNLLQNSDIFPQNLLYRPTDPNFGVATKVVYNHAYGLTTATIEEYYASLTENHYWKNLVLGEIKTAQARDATGQVIYEVVYSQIVDDLVNNQGESVSKVVQLPFPIELNKSQTRFFTADNTKIKASSTVIKADASPVQLNSKLTADNTNIKASSTVIKADASPTSPPTSITSVTPNSLINMRDQVIDVVGQVSNILPDWMISQQENGRVLGFVPAWVIAYTLPGRAAQVAYNIRTQDTQPLNLIDFEVDRYELDRLLTKNWDPYTDNWDPSPPTVTTFDALGEAVFWKNDLDQPVRWTDLNGLVVTWVSGGAEGRATIFDQNSLQFTDPVDMYSTTQEYDKYLVFPKRNILE